MRVTKDADEAIANVQAMLGNTLVTKQTGPAGKQVNRIYVEDGAAIAREFYLALLVDRETSRVSFIASTEGGMDIEEVAAETPEKILTFSVDPATGYAALPRPQGRQGAGPGRRRRPSRPASWSARSTRRSPRPTRACWRSTR